MPAPHLFMCLCLNLILWIRARVAPTPLVCSHGVPTPQAAFDNPRVHCAFNNDVRLSLGLVRFWKPSDYIQAQVREREVRWFGSDYVHA